MNKKIIIFGLLLLVLVSGCTGPTGKFLLDSDGRIILEKDGTIPASLAEERGLSNKIIVLESKNCHACSEAVPALKELETEMKIKIIFLDLSEEKDREWMNEFGIAAKYTPTLVVGGKVYIGAKSKEEYKKILEEFIGK